MRRAGPIAPSLLHAMRWRERLIVEGFDALEAFVAEYPAADAKTLKPMIQKARAMRHKHGTPRFLLRYIHRLDEDRTGTASVDSFDQARVPPTVS